jgi:cation-dependent mannose-6-phosphate receptor
MYPQHPSRGLVLALAALAGVASADEATKTMAATTSVVTPCVATSTNGAFFDLRPDAAVAVVDGEKPLKGIPTEDYIARGWDYGFNFTLNICNPVVHKVEDVVGVDEALWKNVSAYYETKGKVYSLGYGTLITVSGGHSEC